MPVTETDRRLQRHAALADGHRLRIVDALAPSDLTPGQLTTRVGASPSLLAHHLRVLESAGLVAIRRSEGDRRRRYVHLVDQSVAAPAAKVEGRVVFVCTHNSARSQIAEAAWTTGGLGPSASAGTHPAERVHPKAITAATAAGLDISRARTKTMADVDVEGALTISVCDQAAEEVAADLHWSIPDPVRVGTEEAFAAVVTNVSDWIRRRTIHAG